ncbi:MAG: DUF3307 domain-containing protein [Chloroflexi bacterium]|nr:DUF3307 domain-containing protein [Chloroflexota bacterium]
MNLVATLLLGHLIGDFPLQTNWVYQFKCRSSAGVALHVGIHLSVTALLIHDPLHHWPVLAALGLAHFVTDWLKLRFPTAVQTPGFVLDQAAHLAAILLIAPIASEVAVVLPPALLYPALLYATVPAAMTLLWVFANDLGQRIEGADDWIQLARRQMLSLAQLAGFPLLMAVTIARLKAI